MSSFYDYSVTKRDGSSLSMEEFRGKVVLVVNTATDAVSHRSTRIWKAFMKNSTPKGWKFWISPATSLQARLPEQTMKSTASAH